MIYTEEDNAMRWIKWALLAISFLLPMAVADPQWSVVSAEPKPYAPVITFPPPWYVYREAVFHTSTGVITWDLWFEIGLPKGVPGLTATWPLELEWQRFVPPPGGTVGVGYWQTWSVGWKPPPGVYANFKAPEGMEGTWRLRARFAGGVGWPWSQWRQFAIGDPIEEYEKPRPVIHQPVWGAHYKEFPYVNILYTETLRKADGTTRVVQKYPPFEVQLRVWCPRTGWDYYPVKLVESAIQSKLEVSPQLADKCGRWKIRARLKSDITAKSLGGTPLPQPQYPWSDWTVFYTGPTGLALQQEDKAKQPGFHIEPPKARVK